MHQPGQYFARLHAQVLEAVPVVVVLLCAFAHGLEGADRSHPVLSGKRFRHAGLASGGAEVGAEEQRAIRC